MRTYDDVVKALEAELGWTIVSARLTDAPFACALCGEPYETRPVLRVDTRGTDGLAVTYICPDRVACAGRQECAELLVADVVTPLPAPSDADLSGDDDADA